MGDLLVAILSLEVAVEHGVITDEQRTIIAPYLTLLPGGGADLRLYTTLTKERHELVLRVIDWWVWLCTPPSRKMA